MTRPNRARLLALLAALLTAALLAAPAAAAAGPASPVVPVGAQQLIDNAAALDGTAVTFEGEAIGSILPRGDHAWLNLSDGSNSAMGFWLTAEQASQVSALGRYGVTGDRVRVTGIFHRACAEHGGDMDIHVQTLAVVAPGTAHEPAAPAWLPPVALAALALALPLTLLAALRVRRLKRAA